MNSNIKLDDDFKSVCANSHGRKISLKAFSLMFDLCDAQKPINLNCFFYKNINQFNLFMRQINKNYKVIQKIKMKKKKQQTSSKTKKKLKK